MSILRILFDCSPFIILAVMLLGYWLDKKTDQMQYRKDKQHNDNYS
jgi:nitrate reductase gamma subunit